jgi:hypothetical protein
METITHGLTAEEVLQNHLQEEINKIKIKKFYPSYNYLGEMLRTAEQNMNEELEEVKKRFYIPEIFKGLRIGDFVEVTLKPEVSLRFDAKVRGRISDFTTTGLIEIENYLFITKPEKHAPSLIFDNHILEIKAISETEFYNYGRERYEKVRR